MYRTAAALIALSLGVAFVHATDYTPIKMEGVCAMYGQCGAQYEPCVSNTRAVKPAFDLSVTCPHLAQNAATTGVCCDIAQYQTLQQQINQLRPLFGRCPAAVADLTAYWCDFTCSPNQSLFVQVNSLVPGTSLGVNDTQYRVGVEYANAIWNAISNVQFGATNTTVVMQVFGASTPQQLFAFMGRSYAEGGYSPFEIDSAVADSPAGLFNNDFAQMHACNEPAPYACQCTDCPAACSADDDDHAPRDAPKSSFHNA